MSSLESLSSIFKQSLFKIPDYQRGYAWKVDQLVDFWEDLVNLPEEKYHYMGMLSLKRVNKDEFSQDSWASDRWLISDQKYVPYYVVDGQQRLTTLVIFINEIINFVKNLDVNNGKEEDQIYIGSISLKQIREEYIVTKFPPLMIINTYKFGYEVDNPSFKFLKHNVFGEPNGGNIEETFYTLNLENAKLFFRDNLLEYFKTFGYDEFCSLFKKATQFLMFNKHEIEEDFDVFVAFETMNNRGKKLSNLELLKNRLIYLTTLYDKKSLTDDERLTLRAKINESWKEVYYQLGRNKKNPLNDDDFLAAHWIMYFGYTRKRGDDYINYLLDEKFSPRNVYVKTKMILDSVTQIQEVVLSEDQDDNGGDATEKSTKRYKLHPREISDYISSLKTAARYWYNTLNPVNNNDLPKEEQLWLERLNRIGIAYFRPLIVTTYLSDEISSEQRIELFIEIERFIFIAFRMGRAYSSYGSSPFSIAASRLRKREVNVLQVKEDIRVMIESWLSPETGFDINPFKTYMSRKFKQEKGYYDWNGLHYLLYEYEMKKVSEFGNQKIDWDLFIKTEKDTVSIEHIYPNDASNEYWTSRFNQFTKEQKLLLTGSLGNLLPLSKSKNSSLQNDGFDDKKSPKKGRPGYKDGSHSEIEVSNYEEWTSEQILDRGQKILEFMSQRWRIKFKSIDDRIQILFLEFLKDEEDT